MASVTAGLSWHPARPAPQPVACDFATRATRSQPEAGANPRVGVSEVQPLWGTREERAERWRAASRHRSVWARGPPAPFVCWRSICSSWPRPLPLVVDPSYRAIDWDGLQGQLDALRDFSTIPSPRTVFSASAQLCLSRWQSPCPSQSWVAQVHVGPPQAFCCAARRKQTVHWLAETISRRCASN